MQTQQRCGGGGGGGSGSGGACDASGAVVVVDGARKTYYMGTAGWRATVASMIKRLLRQAGLIGGSRGRQAASGGAGAGGG
eukprot:scaffold132642_cov17-Tisochrysis_lutea.AAC.1